MLTILAPCLNFVCAYATNYRSIIKPFGAIRLFSNSVATEQVKKIPGALLLNRIPTFPFSIQGELK